MSAAPDTAAARRRLELRVRRAVGAVLLPWFAEHARDLPWRRNRTAYRVLVSELMLQQSRVEQVLPFYRAFLRRYPSLRALALASRRDVLKAWEGLGYYARARRLHDLARRLVRERGGRFPRTVEGLAALPGLGPYTAAAVGSLAFGLDAAVVDGNVTRVLARVFRVDELPGSAAGRRRFEALANALMLPGRAGQVNEAWMELGALVCTPRAPSCPACPLRRVCGGRASGRPAAWPRRRPRRAVPHYEVGAAVVSDARGRILIAQRREDAMLGGLWEFPGGKREPGEDWPACIRRELREEMGVDVSVRDQLVVVPHAYSHFTIELHAYRATLERGTPRCIHCADFAWVAPGAMRRYPFSRADLKIIEALGAGTAPAAGRRGAGGRRRGGAT